DRYDSAGNQTATIDALGRVTASFDGSQGQDIADYKGQAIKSVAGAAGYSTPGGVPTWTFTNLAPNYLSSYDVYGYSATAALTGAGYTVNGNALGAATDPTAPLLGAGWYFLGTVSG